MRWLLTANNYCTTVNDNNKTMSWKYPKYSVGQQVKTPDGEGRVLQIQWMDNANWYLTTASKGWFKQSELAPN